MTLQSQALPFLLLQIPSLWVWEPSSSRLCGGGFHFPHVAFPQTPLYNAEVAEVCSVFLGIVLVGNPGGHIDVEIPSAEENIQGFHLNLVEILWKRVNVGRGVRG